MIIPKEVFEIAAIFLEFSSEKIRKKELNGEDLVDIFKMEAGYKELDNFFAKLTLNNELGVFQEHCFRNYANPAIGDVYFSPYYAYLLHWFIARAFKDNKVEDIELTRKIVMGNKVVDVLSNPCVVKTPLVGVFETAMFRPVDGVATQKMDIDDVLGIGYQKTFEKIDELNPEFKSHEKSIKAITNGDIGLFEYLGSTGSLIIAFQEVEKGLIDVGVMFYEEDVEKLLSVIPSASGYYDFNDGLFKLGRLDERQCSANNLKAMSNNSEILSKVFKLATNFPFVYLANTGELYANEFLKKVGEFNMIKQCGESSGFVEPISEHYS